MAFMSHNYEDFPELTNKQLEIFQFTSPHEQITEDFLATVVKVHDADTVTLSVDFRDFTFPLRLLGIDAPELSEGGSVAQAWLEARLLDEDVMIMINPGNRVGKYGRLLGRIFHNGMDVGDEMLYLGLVKPFGAINEGEPPLVSELLPRFA